MARDIWWVLQLDGVFERSECPLLADSGLLFDLCTSAHNYVQIQFWLVARAGSFGSLLIADWRKN